MKKPFTFNSHRIAALRFFIGCVGLLAFIASQPASAAEPVLVLTFNNQHQQFTRAELLHLPAVRSIVVVADVAYKKTMTYRAIPLKSLVHDLNSVQAVQFKAEDGFAATIPAATLNGAAQPWLAIEPADAPWPPLKPGGRSAGAFYLVWLSPEKSGISPEQWPYQISAISETALLEDGHPQILPDPALPKNSAEYRGLQAYTTHCASCHRMNGAGDANVGPDLNIPMNPTVYFQAPFLRRYIRDPASVRTWPGMTMPGFPQTVISDPQLDDLLAYLRSMAYRK